MTYTTDLLDDAILAGYSFQAVIDALNAGDHAEAGEQLAAVLDLRAADDVAINEPPAMENLFERLISDPRDHEAHSEIMRRIAMVPVR